MVSRGLAMKELRETRWKHVVGFLCLSAVGLAAVILFDYVRGFLGGLTLPPELTGLLEAQLSDYFVYFWSNWYGKNLYQLATILAIVAGMSLVAAEAGNGTLGFLLTRPLPRASIFATKYLVGAAGLAFAVAGSTGVTWLASRLAGRPVSLARFAPGLVPALAGILVIYGVAVLCSTLSRDQVRAGVAAALVAGALSVPSWFAKSRAFSVYRQMQAIDYLTTGTLRWDAVAGMLAAAVALALAAGSLFVRRET